MLVLNISLFDRIAVCADHDYLYRDDFENFLDEEGLRSLHTAFSRETDRKVH